VTQNSISKMGHKWVTQRMKILVIFEGCKNKKPLKYRDLSGFDDY
jgi:hypothetical protein